MGEGGEGGAAAGRGRGRGRRGGGGAAAATAHVKASDLAPVTLPFASFSMPPKMASTLTVRLDESGKSVLSGPRLSVTIWLISSSVKSKTNSPGSHVGARGTPPPTR